VWPRRTLFLFLLFLLFLLVLLLLLLCLQCSVMPFALKFSEMKHYSIVGEARGDNDRECRDAATQAVCGRTTCMHTICANKHEPTPSSICVGTVFVYTCFQVYCYHYSFHIQMYSTR
jgi:hypothetical protein